MTQSRSGAAHGRVSDFGNDDNFSSGCTADAKSSLRAIEMGFLKIDSFSLQIYHGSSGDQRVFSVSSVGCKTSHP
jgi:hypothetical protein